MQYSSNERPYPCHICGKRFTQKAHLIIHKRTHTGEKPYSCHICHKRFAQSSHLAVHKRVHTGEKPFFCNFCGMGFCRRPRLETHILQHMVKDGRHHLELDKTNQESLDAAAQLMELKMKGGPFSQIKAEPLILDQGDGRLRAGPGGYGTKQQRVIEVIEDGKEAPGTKAWNKSCVTADDLNRLNSGLTELTSNQKQALNKSLLMPPVKMSSSSSSSQNHHMAALMMSTNHSNMVAGGVPALTMSGLVRTNTRVSLIDFTADDILQHLLTRDDIKSCDFCCLVFKDPAMYYLHRSMHDKLDVRCCNLCGKLLKDKYDFTAHYLNQHK